MKTGLIYTVSSGYVEGDHVVFELVNEDGDELEFKVPQWRARELPVGRKVQLVLEEAIGTNNQALSQERGGPLDR